MLYPGKKQGNRIGLEIVFTLHEFDYVDDREHKDCVPGNKKRKEVIRAYPFASLLRNIPKESEVEI